VVIEDIATVEVDYETKMVDLFFSIGGTSSWGKLAGFGPYVILARHDLLFCFGAPPPPGEMTSRVSRSRCSRDYR
jgi:hypothetical protein